MVRNIYESKYYNRFMIVPLVLLVISLYFIPHLQLDSSLKGGVSVQLQTNQTIDISSLTAYVNSHIPNAHTSVEKSPSGVTVTIDANTSIINAEGNVTALLAQYSSYSAAVVNETTIEQELKASPGNSTLLSQLSAQQAAAARYLSAMGKTANSIITGLSPFTANRTFSFNASDPQSILDAANGAYNNASLIYKTQIMGILGGAVHYSAYSYNYVTPTLGGFFLSKVRSIIITAFVIVAIVVLFIFRTPVPSFSVVFGAANDIIVALGFMAVFGIPLGLASVGGLLMLIGYAIDTDTLTAIRILKRSEGTPEARAFASMKTGLTMTLAAIITFTILFIVSYFTFIQTYFEISGVVLIGLVADIATTWLFNTPLVLWYKKRKEVR